MTETLGKIAGAITAITDKIERDYAVTWEARND